MRSMLGRSFCPTAPLLVLTSVLVSACTGDFEDGYLEFVPTAEPGQCYAGLGTLGTQTLEVSGRVEPGGNLMTFSGRLALAARIVELSVRTPIPTGERETVLSPAQLSEVEVQMYVYAPGYPNIEPPYTATGPAIGEARIVQTGISFTMTLRDVALSAPDRFGVFEERGCRVAKIELSTLIDLDAGR